jgi:PAS domain-containing protein
MKNTEVKSILFDEVGNKAYLDNPGEDFESTEFKSIDWHCTGSMRIVPISTNKVANAFHPKLAPFPHTMIQFNSAQEKKLEEIQRNIHHNVSNCRKEEFEGVLNMIRTNTMKSQCSDNVIPEETSDFDAMFSHSRIPQILATPGGRLCAWNDAFVDLIGLHSLESLTAMTIFDLVSPSELPKLHQIFVFALYEELLEKSDGDEELYISLSIPCIHFGPCTKQMFITISLMYDHDPCKRCFHCIISPKTIGEIGKIMHIHQNALTSHLIQ